MTAKAQIAESERAEKAAIKKRKRLQKNLL